MVQYGVYVFNVIIKINYTAFLGNKMLDVEREMYKNKCLMCVRAQTTFTYSDVINDTVT